MYQKPEADETLAPSKEASFMDRMYMKIEAICVEADKNPSLLFQEAGKYFETQVSTAGATMRKVCSELIRDLLPAEDECKHVDKCQCRCEASKKKPLPSKRIRKHRQKQEEFRKEVMLSSIKRVVPRLKRPRSKSSRRPKPKQLLPDHRPRRAIPWWKPATKLLSGTSRTSTRKALA